MFVIPYLMAMICVVCVFVTPVLWVQIVCGACGVFNLIIGIKMTIEEFWW